MSRRAPTVGDRVAPITRYDRSVRRLAISGLVLVAGCGTLEGVAGSNDAPDGGGGDAATEAAPPAHDAAADDADATSDATADVDAGPSGECGEMCNCPNDTTCTFHCTGMCTLSCGPRSTCSLVGDAANCSCDGCAKCTHI